MSLIVGVYWGANTIITNANHNPEFLNRYYQLIVNPELAGGARMNYFTESLNQSKDNIFGWNKIYNNRKLRYAEEGLAVALTGRTHNQYLAVLYAFGLFGLIFYIFYILTVLIIAAKLYLKSINHENMLLILVSIIFIKMIEGLTVGTYYDTLIVTVILALVTKANLNKKWFINVEKDKNYVK